MKKTGCILVCITMQKECDRLIRSGKALADQRALPLHVVHISKDKNLLSRPDTADVLNHLFSLAHEVDAEMNILYDPHPPAAIARYARENYAEKVLMGQDRSGFAVELESLLPEGMPLCHLEES